MVVLPIKSSLPVDTEASPSAAADDLVKLPRYHAFSMVVLSPFCI